MKLPFHIIELLKRKSGSGLRLPSKKKSDTFLQNGRNGRAVSSIFRYLSLPLPPIIGV